MRTIGVLVADSGTDEIAANAISRFIEEDNANVELVDRALAAVILEIDWSAVSGSVRQRWVEWEHSRRRDEPSNVLGQALREAWGIGGSLLGNSSLERAAHFAEDGESSGVTADEAENSVIAALDSEAEQARGGRVGFGGYRAADVAAAVALRVDSPRLWTSLVSFILDEDVDSVLKRDALERLAWDATSVPPEEWERIGRAQDSLLDSPQVVRFFDHFGTLPVFPEAVRLLCAGGVVDMTFAVDAVMRLAESGDRGRAEAAKTLPYAMNVADATWGHSLLLLLSRGDDPTVRGEAAAGLVLCADFESSLRGAVQDRIAELTKVSGLRIPAMMMHAFRRRYGRGLAPQLALSQAIREYAVSPGPRLLRIVAQDVLQRMERQPQGDEHGFPPPP